MAYSGYACMLSHFSRVRLFATPWTVVCQAPLSTGFPRQEYWSGLPCPPPEDLPNPGIKPASPVLQVDSLPLSHLERLCRVWGRQSTRSWNILSYQKAGKCSKNDGYTPKIQKLASTGSHQPNLAQIDIKNNNDANDGNDQRIHGDAQEWRMNKIISNITIFAAINQ